jgi:RNase P subunit RPR2
MLNALLNTLFGCTHSKTTFPFTPGRNLRSVNAGTHRHGTYVVCLDCGQEFQYNWNEMRIGEPVEARPYARPAQSFSPANQ